jgi:pimeloyl-ACP methyl ester carboxylesterase
MSRISINGLGIEYELLGEPGSPAVALTPGGRFSKETPGLRELADRLVAGGKRVLIWDRPNCGQSDLKFDAPSESELAAVTLVGLIRQLELGPTVLAAGSAGSRVSLIAAAHSPQVVSALVLWWISGGPIGLMQLAYGYCCEAANLASVGGMEAVASSAGWRDQVQSNPRARDMLLQQDSRAFIAHMQRWALAYRPSDRSPVPGMALEDFSRLQMPVLIMRNGSEDVSHSPETTDWVHKLIPHSRLIDPPWPDNEWNQRLADLLIAGKAPAFFVNWPELAPLILGFTQALRD